MLVHHMPDESGRGGPYGAAVGMHPEAAMHLDRGDHAIAAVWRHLRIHWLTCRHGYPCSAEILANAEQLKTHSDLLVPGLSGCVTNRHSM